MGVGKTAAQCGHAVGMLDRKYVAVCAEIDAHIDPVYGPPPDFWEKLPNTVKESLEIWNDWDASSFRKVVLKADDKEWEKLKQLSDIPKVVVVDAGLTEIAAGSETVIGFWPMRKSERPNIIRRLQVLK